MNWHVELFYSKTQMKYTMEWRSIDRKTVNTIVYIDKNMTGLSKNIVRTYVYRVMYREKKFQFSTIMNRSAGRRMIDWLLFQ